MALPNAITGPNPTLTGFSRLGGIAGISAPMKPSKGIIRGYAVSHSRRIRRKMNGVRETWPVYLTKKRSDWLVNCASGEK